MPPPPPGLGLHFLIKKIQTSWGLGSGVLIQQMKEDALVRRGTGMAKKGQKRTRPVCACMCACTDMLMLKHRKRRVGEETE